MQRPAWDTSKPWVMQIALFATMAIVGWYAVRPLLAGIQQKMDDIERLNVSREHRSDQLSRLPDLEQQHALIRENEDRMHIVLNKDQLVPFIETLERMARDGGVEIALASRDNTFLESKVTVVNKKEAKPAAKNDEEASVKGKKETGIVTELPMKNYLDLTITVSGEYGLIVNFLHKLETLPFALDVLAVRMKERTEQNEERVFESGTLNPFAPDSAVPIQPEARAKETVLEASFDTAVYMNN